MQPNHAHFKIYKPFGMLSQLSSKDKHQLRKKRFLSELYDFPKGTMPIGRLDEKSEGLLLLTTDGKLSDHINRSGIEKEYYAQINGAITDEAIHKLQNGIVIGFSGKKYKTKPCVVTRVSHPPELPEPNNSIRLDKHRPSTWISITIKEGKFRQVRKMTSAVGYPTLRLVRIRIGRISIFDLDEGEVKPLDIGFENGVSI
ncbi:pseudouridine synthase [Spongiivirga citrea]|uniref:Pseudouridine synthase n=1 Tax=Spongiivirga citrea TaxID=1481457 RepID=A0A6M0CFI0_9FLAO|nr:pseudouridine synthase [Spongiivirga citrea]NER16638.1 pseudouridine synthase [Spongiivirga citrea]